VACPLPNGHYQAASAGEDTFGGPAINYFCTEYSLPSGADQASSAQDAEAWFGSDCVIADSEYQLLLFDLKFMENSSWHCKVPSSIYSAANDSRYSSPGPEAVFPFDKQLTATSSFQSSSSAGLNCKWRECPSGPFSNIEKYRYHLKTHADSARQDWKNRKDAQTSDTGITCTWHGCPSGAKYKSEKLFEQHLVNVHINPLVCTVKHCKHTKPFRANHDLQRHIATAHTQKSKYRCPFVYCSHTVKGFPRKDKWIVHLQRHHDTDPCPYAHCQSLDDPTVGCRPSTALHIAKIHGTFECGLPGCKEKVSGFSDTALSEHLQVAHDMEWAFVLQARDSAKVQRDNFVRIEHLPEYSRRHWCKCCFDN
jgi:hypothetical protein